MNAPGPDLATSPRERPLVSVVAAVFNEEGCIEEFHRRVVTALDGIAPAVDHEIVYVNDGSTDRSLALLHKLAQTDPTIRVLDLSRNFGHQVAVTAGIDHALGDAVVLIDSDLQDPPEVIPEMVERWRAGFKVVYGVRTSRDGETWFKRMTAHVHYWLLNRLSDVRIPEAVGDFRLMDRKVVDVLGSMREENRYLRGMVAWVGFQQCGVEYQRDPRHAGTTGYSLRRMISLSLDAIAGFSERPLRIATLIGTVITFFGLAFATWILISSLTGAQAVKGWPSLMTAFLFIGGVQLLSLGIIGEYVGRVYKETKQRPLYVVGDRINFDDADPPGG